MSYYYKSKSYSKRRSYSYYYDEPSYSGTDRRAYEKAGRDAYYEGLSKKQTSSRYYYYKNRGY